MPVCSTLAFTSIPRSSISRMMFARSFGVKVTLSSVMTISSPSIRTAGCNLILVVIVIVVFPAEWIPLASLVRDEAGESPSKFWPRSGRRNVAKARAAIPAGCRGRMRCRNVVNLTPCDGFPGGQREMISGRVSQSVTPPPIGCRSRRERKPMTQSLRLWHSSRRSDGSGRCWLLG